MTIDILLDPYGAINNRENVCYVESPHDCEQVIDTIEQLHPGKSMEIVVHDRTVFRWFDAVRNNKDIEISSYSPVKELARRLSCLEAEIPEELREDPKSVVETRLLEYAEEFPRESSVSPSKWILKHLFSSQIWLDDNLNETSQVIALIADYAFGSSQESSHPVVLSFRKKRVSKWLQVGSKFANVIKWLFEGEPRKRSKLLILKRLVNKYPHEVQTQALGFDNGWHELSLLENVEHVSELVPLYYAKSMQIPQEFSNCIRDALVKSLDDNGLSTTIKCCSGVLKAEKRELQKYLRDHLEDIDSSWADDLSLLSNIFDQDEDSEDDFSLYLSQLIPRPLPTDLLQVWDWDLVYNWLRTDYMPYYSWCSLTNKVANTQKYVGQFGEWLEKFYPFARSNDAFAPNAIRNLIRPILNNACVLMIIVDALSWEDAVFFRKLLAAQGVKSSGFTGHICALPSETKIAKPAVVSGKPVTGDQSTGLKRYHALLSENLGLDLHEIAASTSSIMPLSDLITKEEKKAYLYLYNEMDKIIHEPRSIEMRRNAVKSCLEKFSEAIGHAVSEYEGIYRRKLAMIISSDHGYTELPHNINIVNRPINAWMSLTSVLHRARRKLIFRTNSLVLLKKERRCITQSPRGTLVLV